MPTTRVPLAMARANARYALLKTGNPYRDASSGRFTHGPGGPKPDGASGASGGYTEGKDITSELAEEYGADTRTMRAQELYLEHMGANYDPVLKDIAQKQGFDGPAELVDQEAFDKIVAEGGTVTHRGIGAYYESPSPSAKYIEGESAITQQYAEGEYFAGAGGYGSGTYTTGDVEIAKHYATEGGENGGVVTMVVKPGAKIATPEQWQAARTAAREKKGGFMGADNEGRILAAQGYDGFRIAAKNVDHFSNEFVVVLNRTAVAVLKK
jgi:hypothetical protein